MAGSNDNPLAEIDPLWFFKTFWPDLYLCDYQREIVYSVENSVETYVVAGNKLGKDYVAGFIVLAFFLRALKLGLTCRIVTTSVAEHHLNVLWGEISRWIQLSKHPLLAKKGGPLVLNHMRITRASEVDDGMKDPLNYLVGRVSEKGEGLAGHHADWTLFVGDEASGIDDVAYEMAQGWAKRMLCFGNPNPCNNFFKKGVEAGTLLAF